MHFLTLRQRASKIYSDTVYSIPMNNDRSHLHINHNKVEETKVVQQKRQIDKIMHGIIKQRLFSHFIEEDTRISDQNYTKITGICKKGFFGNRFKDKRKLNLRDTHKTIDISNKKLAKSQRNDVKFSTTIQFRPQSKQQFHSIDTISKKPARFFQSQSRPRRQSIRLPDFERTETAKTIKIRGTNTNISHTKKLQFNQKGFHQTFRKWSGNNQMLINQIKISKDIIISKLKYNFDGLVLEKFFYFFGFPQLFSLRQYVNLIQNAANSSLRFIYFWVFIILDDNTNGVLTSQQLFKFLQRFPENDYIQQQIFILGRYITKLEKVGKNQKIDEIPPPQESLTVNRNLKMQQLKDILKQSTKQRIEVNCVKNTCYHRTILSLEHDTLQRAKLNQIQNNQQMTKLMKLKRKDEKKKVQNLPGIRLRDLHHIFNGKRPKIFCYVLYLLTGLRPNDYQ